MREGSLWFIYVQKFLELLFLIVVNVLMFVTGIIFLKEVKASPKSKVSMPCLVLVPICIFLATVNTLYNNLLINMRFKCKICCKTCGVCLYDCLNNLMCYCCLKRFCRDRCF